MIQTSFHHVSPLNFIVLHHDFPCFSHFIMDFAKVSMDVPWVSHGWNPRFHHTFSHPAASPVSPSETTKLPLGTRVDRATDARANIAWQMFFEDLWGFLRNFSGDFCGFLWRCLRNGLGIFEDFGVILSDLLGDLLNYFGGFHSRKTYGRYLHQSWKRATQPLKFECFVQWWTIENLSISHQKITNKATNKAFSPYPTSQLYQLVPVQPMNQSVKNRGLRCFTYP